MPSHILLHTACLKFVSVLVHCGMKVFSTVAVGHVVGSDNRHASILDLWWFTSPTMSQAKI